MPLRASLRPEADIAPAPWVVAERGKVGDFSAIGYHFARQMHLVQGVPIGLVQTAWGGSHLETWVRRDAALQDPDLAPAVRALPADNAAYIEPRRREIEATVGRWQPGLPWQGVDASGWSAADDAVDANWPGLQAPGVWEGQGLANVDGVVWMRRKVELDAAQAAGAATLRLAKVDDCDETWVNGQRVGGLCGHDRARSYELPAGLLRAGANWIAVRVSDYGGGGGIYGDADLLRLDTAAGPVSLAGAWRARVADPRVPSAPTANDAPTLAHNGLIAPLQDLPLRGVLWYQGESNTGRAAAYGPAFQRLIQDWRAQFRSPQLPFFFVQLAAHLPLKDNRPGHGGWAELRDAQAQALALPHTGMAVAIDVGDEHDIHPRDKRTLGQRLAALALRDAGLRRAEASGPRVQHVRLRGAELRLGFTATAGALRGFLLAGEDRVFHPAQARIEGRHVVLSSAAVPAPVAARYAWVDNPSEANLVGGDGLPAAPLRTDRWPLDSVGRGYTH